MRGKVTEEQIEAGRAAVFAIGADPVAAETLEAIYLAMRAKEAPCPDDVERALEYLRADGWGEEEAYALSKIADMLAALSSIQGGVTPDDVERVSNASECNRMAPANSAALSSIQAGEM